MKMHQGLIFLTAVSLLVSISPSKTKAQVQPSPDLTEFVASVNATDQFIKLVRGDNMADEQKMVFLGVQEQGGPLGEVGMPCEVAVGFNYIEFAYEGSKERHDGLIAVSSTNPTTKIYSKVAEFNTDPNSPKLALEDSSQKRVTMEVRRYNPQEFISGYLEYPEYGFCRFTKQSVVITPYGHDY